MARCFISIFLALLVLVGNLKKARAYDMDCAIMLCMAGGFPPSVVCAAAYRTMIRRITPWPSLPPFGICTYSALPAAVGGSGEDINLNTSMSNFEWLNRTHVIWFTGGSYEPRNEPRQWRWTIKSCDHENRTCRYIERVNGSMMPWEGTFTSESGQELPRLQIGGSERFTGRAIMVEFGDYQGNLDHSGWFSY